MEFILKSVRLKKPFCWLPGSWNVPALSLLTGDSDALTPPYPDMVISSGRRSVAIARAIKRASSGKTKLVHVQNPRISPRHFDLVVAMAHDKISGGNVISTRLALHHLTHEKLAAARAAWAEKLHALPSPRIAIFIGGSTHAYTLSKPRMHTLINTLKGMVEAHSGSVWISTSRRTGLENSAMLERIFAQEKNLQIYTGVRGQGSVVSGETSPPTFSRQLTTDNRQLQENPYLAWLASADILVVTNDSVSMMSEACFTGKPLYLLPLSGHQNTKPAAFAEMLVREGYAKWFALPLAPFIPRHLDERGMVVDAIRTRVLPLK